MLVWNKNPKWTLVADKGDKTYEVREANQGVEEFGRGEFVATVSPELNAPTQIIGFADTIAGAKALCEALEVTV